MRRVLISVVMCIAIVCTRAGAQESIVPSPEGALPPPTNPAQSGFGLTGRVADFDVSRDGTRLVVLRGAVPNAKMPEESQQANLSVWDLSTGRQVSNFNSAEKWVRLTLSPNGKYALVGLRTSGQGPPTSIALDVVSGKEVRRITGTSGALFSADGKKLVHGEIAFYDIRSEKRISHQIKSRGHLPVACSPVANIAAVGWTGVEGNKHKFVIDIYDIDTGKVKKSLRPSGMPAALAFSGDGNVLAATTNEGKIVLYDTATWQPRTTLNRKDTEFGEIKTPLQYFLSVAVSRDGSVVAVPGKTVPDQRRDGLIVWTVESNRVNVIEQTAGVHEKMFFLPDGKVAYLTYDSPENSASPIRFFDPSTEQPVQPPFGKRAD